MKYDDTYFYWLEEEERVIAERVKAGKKLNKVFRKDHKRSFQILTVLAVFVILFNIGAVVITNMLVIKNNPDTELSEANPVQAKMNNYQYKAGGTQVVLALGKQCLIWTVLIGAFVYWRNRIYTLDSFYTLSMIVLFYFVLTAFDFFNDFGYLLGKLIY